MRLSHLALNAGIVLAAGLLALLVAYLAAGGIERAALRDISARFALQGVENVTVATSGLQVTLSGEVQSEAARFRALSAAGQVVDNARLVDHIEVAPPEEISPPDFSVEMLRNEDGIQLIGLVPEAVDRAALARKIARIGEGVRVVDLLQSADYPVPEGWEPALDFALEALARLERSKISAAPGRVAITAIAGSAGERRALERELARRMPGGLELSLEITAPRPVLTPFTMRFVIEAGADDDQDGGQDGGEGAAADGGEGTRGEAARARFDACAAHGEEGRERILAAARQAGVRGEVHCPVALGAPSAEWDRAVVAAIRAVSALGGGSVTFSDADITLIAPRGVSSGLFDRVSGDLEAALPEVFSLHAVLPEPEPAREAGGGMGGAADGSGGEASADTPEFIATLSPEGQVQLRGRLRDEAEREVAESYARARFGIEAVHLATRLDPDLPKGWLVRVLAALEGLSRLSNGSALVEPGLVEIRGNTGDREARAEISRLMGEKLGEAQDFRISVTYREALDPVASRPGPQECVDRMNRILEAQKITFAPGSADITAEARDTIDKIAEAMKECQDVPMEIGGFTDSQGREEMNKALSQARAQAVLNALLARRVLTSNLVAHGYGEANPIADNGTEEGREANRRIEFRLILSEHESASGEKAQEQENAAGAAVPGGENGDGTAVAGEGGEDAPADSPSSATGDRAGENN